jgi:hypothetical protein
MVCDNTSLVLARSTITGAQIFNYSPKGHNVMSAIFSNKGSSTVFAATKRETVQINITDGSVTPFSGHPTGDHSCLGNVMALNTAGTVLFVGYIEAQCVVAYDVPNHHQIWTTKMASSVSTVSYHAGMVLVGVFPSDIYVLCEGHGSILRLQFRADTMVVTHAVIDGLSANACAFLLFCALK